MSKCWNLCTLGGIGELASWKRGKWRSGSLIRDALLFARLVLFPPPLSLSPFSCGSFIMENGTQKETGRDKQAERGRAGKLSFLAAFLGLLKSQLVSANN